MKKIIKFVNSNILLNVICSFIIVYLYISILLLDFTEIFKRCLLNYDIGLGFLILVFILSQILNYIEYYYNSKNEEIVDEDIIYNLMQKIDYEDYVYIKYKSYQPSYEEWKTLKNVSDEDVKILEEFFAKNSLYYYSGRN